MPPPRFDKLDDPVVARALDFMRVRFHEAPSIEQVARETGVSRRLLEQRFQAGLASTPYQALLSIKMERVCQLLQHSDKRVLEISQLCGFSSQHQLSNSFKRIYGKSPRAYREEMLAP